MSSVKDLFRDIHYGDLDLSVKSLTKLPDGLPYEVQRDFNCAWNSLTNLVGCPTKIARNFYCSYNLLESLEGAPEEVGGDFHCRFQSRGRKFTEAEVRAHCNVKGTVIIEA